MASTRIAQADKPRRVVDVAAYILEKMGSITAWKLQKLCYYAQAWSLVWDDAPLFREKIEAWANGPVVPALYERHRGQFVVDSVGGDPTTLSPDQRETVDAVIKHYGGVPAAALIALTHRERPWKAARARARLSKSHRGDVVMPLDLMAEFYGGLYAAEDE